MVDNYDRIEAHNTMETPRAKQQRHADPMTLPKPLVLIGLMGAGKSKIGRMLAGGMNVPFADSDNEIEHSAGMSIASIFDRYGEPSFRDLEVRVLTSLITGKDGSPPGVVATGGGAFMRDEIRTLIRDNAISIWLRAEPATLAGRISNTDSRPLLKGKDAAAVLTDLAEQRYPVYAGADLIVDTDGLTTDAAVKKVSAAMHHYLETIRTNEPS